MKVQWKRIVVTGVAAATILGSVPVAYPAQLVSADSIQDVLAKQQIKITQNAVLTIKESQLLVQEQGKLLAFTVAIKNSGTTSINLLDYWVSVKNKSDKKFKLKLSEMDKNKGTVVPGATTYLTYYAFVDSETRIEDIVYEVVKWDFSQPNYERLLGTITTPAKTNGTTDAFKASEVLINNSNVTGALKSYVATKDQANTNATLRFKLINTSSKSVDISKINFHVQTSDWSVYKAEAYLEKQSLAPKESIIILLDVTIPNSELAKKLTLVPALIDETNKIELPVGAYALPSLKATTPIGKNKSHTLQIENEQIKTLVASSEVAENDGRQEAIVKFNVTNTGKKTLNGSQLEFTLETSAGTQYPLEYKKEDVTKLLPNIETVYELKGFVPNEINLNSSKLIVKNVIADGTKNFTLGTYALSGDELPSSSGNVYRTRDYEVNLISVNRVPDQVDDYLVTQLAITNTSDKAIKIPQLTGYYMADGVKVETSTSEVALDFSINLAPKATHQFIVYTKIPYTTEIGNVAFVLTQKSENQTSKSLFEYKAQIPETVGQSIKSPYIIENIGKRANVNIKYSSINESHGNPYFYGEFELTNKETRASNVTQLGGYLEDANGVLVPITFTGIEERVLPNGKVLYAAYGQLPNQFNSSKYKLYLGQALPIGSSEKSETLLINPVAYNMSTQSQLNSSLQSIQFGGYTLDITEVQTGIKITNELIYEGIDLKLKYNLERNKEYQYTPKDQKIMIELVDQGPAKATYSKEYTLSESGEDNLDIGAEIRLPIFFEDAKLMTKINSFQSYVVNIYTTFGNEKLLIASKEIKWFDVFSYDDENK